MRLIDKVVLVTGSATGIGRGIALRAAADGARVVVHGLEEDLVAAVVAEIDALGRGPGRRAVGHVGELADADRPRALVDLAIDRFGRLDGLVNNAAAVLTGDVHSTDAALFERIMRVNALVPLLLIQAALPHLRTTRGCVLNIGSVNAWCGEPNLLPYAMSKGALMTLTRNLGDVLFREDGIRVNQINPGWVLTENESRRKQAQGFDPDWQARIPRDFAPSGRLFTPAEIAAVAVTFLADDAGPVSGQVCDLEQYPFFGRNPLKHLDPRAGDATR
ncbi:MAG: SDR family NAD(P)-dependent oxidoreductase [Planctomycetaceae bacterium]